MYSSHKHKASHDDAGNQIIIDWMSINKHLFTKIFDYGVISFAVVLVFLVIFNSLRGRSSRAKCSRFISKKLLKNKISSKARRTFLKVIVWIAFGLSDLMATYSIGVNKQFLVSEGRLTVWTIFLYYISCCDDFFLPNFKDFERNIEKHFDLNDLFNLRNTYQGYLIFKSIAVDYFLLQLALSLLWFSSGSKVLCRLLRVFMARRGDALVSDYMAKDRDNVNNADTDTDSMLTYRYPMITLANFKACYSLNTEQSITVTLDKIWQCQGKLLSIHYPKSAQLKDICLSFALFNLLRRRFNRFPLFEASLVKTKYFVLQGLLSRDDDLLRAFRVVQVELKFLYDFLYKKIDFTFYIAFLLTLANSIGVLVGSFWLFIGTSQHKLSTIQFLALSISLLEVWHFCNYVCSDWTLMMLLTKYVEQTSWQNSCMVERLIVFIHDIRSLFRPAHLMLGQCSLVESSSSFSTYALQYAVFVNPINDDMIKLRDEVKVAVLKSLKASNGNLSNGESSLERHGVDKKFLWVWTLKTSSEIIWVWHIATSMCEIASTSLEFRSCLGSTSQLSGDQYNFTVAVSLSRYCAYLAVFAHDLLPDEYSLPPSIFRKLWIESSNELRDFNLEEKFKKMWEKGGGSPSENDTLFMKGVKLGRQLVEEIEDESKRWQILGDFWAELMLYLAPSEELAGHADHLADGEEFITYLWVLLTHAGVLKRPSNNIQNPCRSS